MKYLRKSILTLLSLLIMGGAFCVAGDLRVEIPNGDGFEDIIADDQFISGADADNTFTKFVQLVNTYLWIVVLIVFMIMLIYTGFILITSRGDAEKFKRGNMMLLYIGIGLGVALLAYVIVNIVVNFF